MAADHAALFRAVGARLAAVARRIGDVFARQLVQREDLVAVEVHQRGLRGGQHEFAVGAGRVGDPVVLLHKFRELPGDIAAFVVQHMRRQDQLIAVAQVFVHKEVEQRPLHARAPAAVDPGAVSADLRAALVVDHAVRLAEVHVVFHREVEDRLLLEIVQRDVLLLAARHDVLVRQVRQGEHQVLLLFLQLAELRVVLLDLRGEDLHLRHQFGGVLARLLHGRDLLGRGVLLRLLCLHLAGDGAAVHVNLQNLVDHAVEIHFSLLNGRFYLVRFCPDHL